MFANMEVNINFKTEGKLAKLIANLEPKFYHNYLLNKNGKNVMHVKQRDDL